MRRIFSIPLLRGDSSSFFLGRLLTFRERPACAEVGRQEGSFSASNAFIVELNSLLKQHPGVIALQRKGETLGLETAFELEKPSTFGLPLQLPSPNCYRIVAGALAQM